MKKKYEYSLNDESLTTPYLYKWFVDPLLKITPYGLPANIITLFSNLMVLIAFIIVTMGYINDNYFLYWLVPILVFIYLVGDALDGRQARRTKTGSQLGEYFDHFLDSFVSGQTLGMLMMAYRVPYPFVVFIALYCGYLSQSSAFYERYFTNVMYFGKVGSGEGVIVMSLLILISPLKFMINFTNILPIFGIPLFYYILSILLLIPIKSAYYSVVRSQNLTKGFVIYALLNIVVVGLSSLLYPLTFSIVLITLFNVDYIQGLLISTGLKIKDKDCDFIVPTLIIALYLLYFDNLIVYYVLVGYLFIKISIRFIKYFKEFKHCWYWRNPKIEEVSVNK